MVGCAGNAPTLVLTGTTALQAAHDLYVANNPWLRDVESHHDMKAYEAPLVLNLPAILKMVDRRGYAPRTAGCKPADFLTNLAAQKVARRLGAAPSPRSFGDSAAQAGARRVLCVFKNGAVSRICTGIP